MSPLEVLQIENTSSQWKADGASSSKSFPEDILIPGVQVDEVGRIVRGWQSREAYGGTTTLEDVIGLHRQKGGAGTIQGSSTTRITLTGANGYHVWVQPSTITDITDPLTISGTSIDACGATTASDTEDITIDSTVDKVYCSNKRWIGSVILKSKTEGSSPALDIVTAYGIVDPYNGARTLRIFQAWQARWRPSTTPWQVTIDAYLFVPGDTTTGSKGLVALTTSGPSYPRTFADTDATPRAQVSSIGTDFDSQLDNLIDPMSNEGIVLRLGLKNVDQVDFWGQFYRF